MNLNPTLTAFGLPLEPKGDDTFESVLETLSSAVSQVSSADLDERMNEQYKQAGTVAWTSEEYFASDHGQRNSKVELYEISQDPVSAQPASWWPEPPGPSTSVKRPLAELKVVDLTRAIAGPAITRSLAEMSASDMPITSPHVTDLSALHQDLKWGRWNCCLHLKDEADKDKLRQLILEADVVVDGYRPGVMDRLGLGRQAVSIW